MTLVENNNQQLFANRKVCYNRYGKFVSYFLSQDLLKYKISTIISQKFQCISNTFLQNSVKISKCNHSCKFKHIYYYYIDIYLCLFAFESPRRITFRFRVPYLLLKSSCNEGGRRGELIYRYEA